MKDLEQDGFLMGQHIGYDLLLGAIDGGEPRIDSRVNPRTFLPAILSSMGPCPLQHLPLTSHFSGAIFQALKNFEEVSLSKGWGRVQRYGGEYHALRESRY